MGSGYQFGGEPTLIEGITSSHPWKIIYFIRHAQTSLNAMGVVDGVSASTLTKKGEAQAIQLSSALRQRYPNLFLQSATKIVASPAQRAVETARRVFENITFDIDADFIEVNSGRVQGRGWIDSLENKLISPNFCVSDQFPDGESYIDAQLRAINALERYFMTEHYNIVLVAHGGIIALLLLALMRIPATSFPFSTINNASLTVVEIYKSDEKIFSKLRLVNATFC